MKKLIITAILGIFFAAVMSIAAGAWSGSGTEADPWLIGSPNEGDVTAVLSGTGANLTLTISGTGAMADFNTGGGSTYTPWYINYQNNNIRTVVVGNGVTNISKFAFWYCHSITSLRLPDSLKTIDNVAFCQCTGLTSITIPSGVTSIGANAFSECSNLRNITIPSSVTSIGKTAFYKCTGLTSITIPDGVTSIGESTFEQCDSLTSITLPDSVTSIGKYAFTRCNALTSIIIPAKVESIVDQAFYNCRALTSITLPASLKSIGDSAFTECRNLTTVIYKGTAEQWGDVVGNNRISLGKIYLYVAEKAATCTAKGMKAHYEKLDGTVGTLEGTTFTEIADLSTLDIPALGHDFVNGVCTRCGAKDPNYKEPEPEPEPEPQPVKNEGGAAGIALPSFTTKDAKVSGNSVKLSWSKFPYADKFTVFMTVDGVQTKLKTTKNNSLTVKGLKNGVTYRFMVTFTVGTWTSPESLAATVTVTPYFKPLVSAKLSDGNIRLGWKGVPDAEGYIVYKLVDGKLKQIAETAGTSALITNAASGKEYVFAVSAIINGEKTGVKKSDLVTVKL